MRLKTCPICAGSTPEFRFHRQPRISVPLWDETMLPPVCAPRSGSRDWAFCAGMIEQLEWLAHDVRKNSKLGYPGLLQSEFRQIVATANQKRGRGRSYPLPRFIREDVQDPIFIALQTMEHLLEAADVAAQNKAALPEDILLFLICRTEAALKLGRIGIDLRFEVLEALLVLLHDLLGSDGEFIHAW